MTDSEKLDLLLSEISGIKIDMHSLKTDVSTLKSDVSTLKTDVSELKSDVSDLKQRATKLELHIENVTDKNISLLCENCIPAAKQYEKATKQIDAMQTDKYIIYRV